MGTYRYFAQQFRSRAGAQPLILFVAPAGEIKKWAGVPRKAFDYLHGFQRSLNSERVAEVATFFREDEHNISPTAIVVGLGRSTRIENVSPIQRNSGLEAVEVIIEAPDLAEQSLEALATEVLMLLEQRLQPETVEAIRDRTEEAVAEAQRLEDEEAVYQSAGGESPDGDLINEVDRSFLEDFYAQLLGQVQGDSPWPADATQLREVLYSLLKPAIIVDGQHRVFGASQFDPQMKLAVCAMPDSNWVENVYQFVVINQKAKPIKPAFLSAIIATSLSQSELTSVYHRLRASRVDVDRSELMEQLNSDPSSPFHDMIDFEVPGSPGFLSFPGMWRLAEAFRSIDVNYPVLLQGGEWPDGENAWLPFFFAFWDGIKETFVAENPGLWKQSSPSNPSNLLKIVTLQEVQRMTLDLWADTRMAVLTTPDATREKAMAFWQGFPPQFFTDEWRQKGLQTQVGRALLRDALVQTRRKHGQKSWGHRRLGLFKETSA